MRVLVACEMSGRVREAFAAKGHDSWSCDIMPSLIPGQHYQCDVLDVINQDWDLLIAFPPCTNFSYAGSNRFYEKAVSGEIIKSLKFVKLLHDCDIPRICIENPRGLLWKLLRSPDQIIQPFQFGHPYTKYTCLWLKNLRLLMPTHNIGDRSSWMSATGVGYSRKIARSLTFDGVASAMAAQWNY